MIYRDVGKKMVYGFNKGMRDNVSSVGKKFAKASVQIKDAPTEDVAPVVHAKWKYRFDTGIYQSDFLCSNCNGLIEFPTAIKDDEIQYLYCPNCGAKMDEEQ